MRNTILIGGIVAALLSPTAQAEDPHPRELEEIIVTAAPLATDSRSMAQPASILTGDALTLALAPTIGETLSGKAGVQSTFFGPAASRPVIRGLGGDRVRVLTDGLATLDASGLSEDHAVAIDPALADQIEVVRGPATLLHGSGAAGGLVNVVTNRLHRHAHESPSGLLEVRGDSALGEKAAAGRVDTGVGAFALHADGTWRETDDYEIPGFAESRRLRALEEEEQGEVHEEMRGKVGNSWSRTKSGGAGASYIGERWQFGLAASVHDTRYGVPIAHHHEEEEGEEEEEEGGVSIDLEQKRLDFRARAPLTAGDGPVLELRGAMTDYEHTEVEPTGEIGTLFEVDGEELRASVDFGKENTARQSTLGLQWQQSDLEAIGEEAFIPGTQTRTQGLFGFQRLRFDTGSLEYGVRFDEQRITGAPAGTYDEGAINVSVGGVRSIGESLSLVGQLSRSERHPSATELFADGAHVATQQFEIGDPDLDTERGITAEAGLRFDGYRVAGEVRIFTSHYDDYIFLAAAGEQADGLPVFNYRQEDSRFEGFEVELELPLGDGPLALALTGEYVRGKLDESGDLPRMPPLGLGARLAYSDGPWAASLSVNHHFEQDQVTELELPTDAYTMLDADLVFRPDWMGNGLMLFLRARNLLDEDARMHTSPLKDQLPLPGRSIGAGIRIAFGG
ncbi:MAG: TonB-dependent receptor [Pseudomonadota bacterium]|nr:TonB-dependent receptor [Pseudomonadota bacterium]